MQYGSDCEVITQSCTVCGGQYRPSYASDVFACRTCSYYCSTFTANPQRLQSLEQSTLDEGERINALRALRLTNFDTILNTLETYRSLDGATLCDVGCAHGWFLELAAARGVKALGIEPEPAISAEAKAKGYDIREGYFPECLSNDELFDLIVFNDVLEHLPDPGGILRSCYQHLQPNGMLVVNAPSSKGFLFRVATALARVGVRGPIDRLWQRAFHSPHLSYFSPENLEQLARNAGFALVHNGHLKSVQVKGLWSRLAMDSTASFSKRLFLYLGLLSSYPILEFAPKDILFQIYRKLPEQH